MALWFLIVDLVGGEPLYTPTALANWLVGVKEGSQTPAIPLNAFDVILSYTWVHWLVFVALGGIVSWLISATERNPDLGFGVVLLITILVVAVTGFISVFATQVLHVLTWPAILVGNLLAAAVMATYLWRRHRHLRINL
jgi:lipopolysaccharide export LptBFGC system permease protein LptF